MAEYARYTEARVNASEYVEMDDLQNEFRRLACERIGEAATELLWDVTDMDGPEDAGRVIFLAVFKAPAVGDYERWMVAEVTV
jgi:hypothetical protein